MARACSYLRGGAVSYGWADARLNLTELISATVLEALADADTDIDEIDSVVLAAHDMVDGRSLTSMTTAPAAGAYLREEIRLGDDGAFALATAHAQLLASQASNVIIAAWGRASENDSDAVSRALFDPFYLQPLGLRELEISAMRASAALGTWPDYAVSRSAARERLTQIAQRRGLAHGPVPQASLPLADGEIAPSADVVAAVILSAGEAPVAVLGTGMSAEPYWPGDRRLLTLTALAEASERALAASGQSIEAVDCFELDAPTLFDQALALEAVGAAPPGAGMRALAEDPRSLPSGGYAMGGCAPACGLVRTVTALEQLRADGGPRLALVSGSSTVAAQTQAAAVLARC